MNETLGTLPPPQQAGYSMCQPQNDGSLSQPQASYLNSLESNPGLKSSRGLTLVLQFNHSAMGLIIWNLCFQILTEGIVLISKPIFVFQRRKNKNFKSPYKKNTHAHLCILISAVLSSSCPFLSKTEKQMLLVNNMYPASMILGTFKQAFSWLFEQLQGWLGSLLLTEITWCNL